MTITFFVRVRAKLVANLWGRILPEVSNSKIADFRRPGNVNSRFAHWEPSEASLRWFKSYLLLAVLNASDRQREILGKIHKTCVGNPVTVRNEGKDISFDYLLAAEEMSFLERHFSPNGSFSVTEVGGGFGRTAHSFVSVYPNLESYTLVDLPPVLELARSYLSMVLNASDFSRINFVDASEFLLRRHEPSNIAIQIDGLQEFGEKTIVDYLSYFSLCDFVFISTPIGKYSALKAGLRDIDADAQQFALGTGRLSALVDPWDLDNLDKHREAAVEAYRPANMAVVGSAQSRLRPFYQQTLYRAQLD